MILGLSKLNIHCRIVVDSWRSGLARSNQRRKSESEWTFLLKNALTRVFGSLRVNNGDQTLIRRWRHQETAEWWSLAPWRWEQKKKEVFDELPELSFSPEWQKHKASAIWMQSPVLFLHIPTHILYIWENFGGFYSTSIYSVWPDQCADTTKCSRISFCDERQRKSKNNQ